MNDREYTTPVWITKYLFTRGIQQEMAFVFDDLPGMITVRLDGGLNGEQYFHGKDWHRSLAEAKAQAFKMITKKRATIAKQIRQLNKLDDDLKDRGES